MTRLSTPGTTGTTRIDHLSRRPAGAAQPSSRLSRRALGDIVTAEALPVTYLGVARTREAETTNDQPAEVTPTSPAGASPVGAPPVARGNSIPPSGGPR